MKKIQFLIITCFCLILFQSCNKDSGTIEVTFQEATAIYGDLEEVRSMAVNVAPKEVVNPGKIFISEDFVLIGEEGVGIHVVDNANRFNPVHTSFINIPGNKEYYVEGTTLYAESHYDILKIDISNPNQASIISRAKEAIQNVFEDENGNALLGFNFTEKTVLLEPGEDFYNRAQESSYIYYDYARNIIPNSAIPASFAGNSAAQSGTVNRVSKNGDHVYVISNNNMIVLNDNDFEQNFVKHERIMWDDMETIFPYNNNLFVGARSSMSIFSLNDPMNPTQTFTFSHATSCDPVLPHNDVAYITLRTTNDFTPCQGDFNSLVVVDIEDIANAREVTELDMQSPYGMSVVNDILFVGEGVNGLKLFDISDKTAPEIVKRFLDIEAYDIIADPIDNRVIFIAGPNGLNQYMIDENLNMDLQSTIEI